MITNRCKEEILERADVVEVISDFVELTRRGTDYVCCCPFHGEKTPSFHVNPARNFWHCFGCNRGGDAAKFLVEQGMSFGNALEYLAKKYNVTLQFEKRERTEEEQAEDKRRLSMLTQLEYAQQFFVEQLAAGTPESKAAREYAFGRWGETFCREVGIGFAPRDSRVLLDYIRSHALSQELFLETRVLSASEKDGSIYATFRERITIPVRNRLGKVIAFTARYIGTNTDVAKYINSPTSLIYEKKHCLFGIDVAARQARVAGSFIVVEGAPDTLRLHSLGLTQAVAPLGTALTEKQLELMRRSARSIIFIPDGDPPKEGAHYGSGIEAVIRNGALAMRRGFDVSVREIPAAFDKEGKQVKQDPDSYITSKEVYNSLSEQPFAVWLAEKRFAVAASQNEEFEVMNEIATLLIFIEDKVRRMDTIERLAKVYGSVKRWKDIVRSVGTARKSSEAEDIEGFSPREVEKMEQFGIIVRHNMYYSASKEGEQERLSNFVLRPVIHVADRDNSRRIFEICNCEGRTDALEVSQKTLSSVQAFQVAVESLGAYVWLAKQDKLNRLKEYLYSVTETAKQIDVLGWDSTHNFFAFANGIYANGKFLPIDELGIVHLDNEIFYLPAFSKMYSDQADSFDFERMFEYRHENTDTLRQFVERLCEVFGKGGKVGFAWVLACMFRDHIHARKDWFPMLNLFGIKGSGKTALAMALASFFYVRRKDPPKLGNTTIPALSYMFCHARNAVIVLDEYTNLLQPRYIDILKGIWGGTANTKMNMTEGGASGIVSTPVYSGVVFCGQHAPTADPAVFSRCVHLCYTNTTFTTTQNRAFIALKEAASLGNAHHAMEIMSHREHFIESFDASFTLTRKEVKDRLGDELIEDRVLENWVAILASFRVLETAIDVPFSYAELFEICVEGIRYQMNEINKTSEQADFWDALNSLHMVGKAVEGTHYIIKYQHTFQPFKSDTIYRYPRKHRLLYMCWSAVKELIMQRRNINLMKMDVGALDNYLRNSPYFLGLKQQRFVRLTASGTPDFEFSTDRGEQTKRMKVSRPMAYVFDYDALIEHCDIDLETVVSTESEINAAEEEPEAKQLSLGGQDEPF